MCVRFRWFLAAGLAGLSGVAGAQGQIPGACQPPDMAAYATDDDRHAAIRGYLLCLQDEHFVTQQALGMLPRSSLGTFEVRPAAVRAVDQRGADQRSSDRHGADQRVAGKPAPAGDGPR